MLEVVPLTSTQDETYNFYCSLKIIQPPESNRSQEQPI